MYFLCFKGLEVFEIEWTIELRACSLKWAHFTMCITYGPTRIWRIAKSPEKKCGVNPAGTSVWPTRCPSSEKWTRKS